ncbi:MAG: hypothetical protein Q4P24_05535 [Rhodobacterales bacterium]|nr:hypothetical protein [Rhodobacterales bacterium]
MVNGRSQHLGSAYRRLIDDPLRKLRRLMVHRRIDSTYVYLDHVEDAQAIVDAAVSGRNLELAKEAVE